MADIKQTAIHVVSYSTFLNFLFDFIFKRLRTLDARSILLLISKHLVSSEEW